MIPVARDPWKWRDARWIPAEPLSAEQVARMFRVPYWYVAGPPRPSWLRRPLWRLRALVWARRR